MESSEFSQSRGRRAYVVYETGTGRIVHTVYVDVMKGAELPSQTEVERQVIISASHVTGIAKETLSHLLVDSQHVKPGVVYEVNPKTQDLVERKVISARAKPR